MVTSIVASVLPSAATTTAPVTSTAITLPVGFEIVAIFAGALAGGMTGVRRGFDIAGAITLAIVAGLGGGIIRDVLLQDQGIFALDNPRALSSALVGAAVAMFFLKAADKARPALTLIDALSLGLFCLVGADKALIAGLTPLSAIMLGVVTAVGGGMLRDILCGLEPEVLRRGSLYSSAAIVGSTLYVVMAAGLNITKPLAMLLAATVAVVMRMGSIWFGWESPEPVDLTDRVVKIPGGAVNVGRGLLRGRARQPAPGSTDDDEWSDSQN
jgi:uncharacterized membrane protein YeiH